MMKYKLASAFVCMLLFVAVFSATGAETSETSTGAVDFTPTESNSMDMWDIHFQIDSETPGGGSGIAGVEFDGEYFYCAEWGYEGATTIYVLDADGNYVDEFASPTGGGTSNGIRDMAWDGQYLYGGAAGSTIYCFDTDGNTITTISSPAAVRSIAYDERYDAFWVNNWDEDLVLVDRSGSTLDTISGPPSLYGTAYDGLTQIDGYDGPFLWIFTGTSTGGGCQIECYDLATKTLTGVTHSVSGEISTDAIAGGLCFTEEYTEGIGMLCPLAQMTPSTIIGYEVCTYVTNDPAVTPAAPTGPTTGYVGDTLTFSGVTTDPESDTISYQFDFGDGTTSAWVGPEASGTAVTTDYSYAYAGTFEVKVRAKDSVNGAVTAWSDPLTVVIENAPAPDVEVGDVAGGFLKVSAVIENNGNLEASTVDWSITVSGNGGFVLVGAETTGQVASIPAGGNVTVESGAIIGFGKALFSIAVEEPAGSSDTANKYGSIFLVFIKVL